MLRPTGEDIVPVSLSVLVALVLSVSVAVYLHLSIEPSQASLETHVDCQI